MHSPRHFPSFIMFQREILAEQNPYIQNPEERKKKCFLSEEELVSQPTQEAPITSAPLNRDLREWFSDYIISQNEKI